MSKNWTMYLNCLVVISEGMDKVFVTIRNIILDHSKKSILRQKLLEVLELRARKWPQIDSDDNDDQVRQVCQVFLDNFECYLFILDIKAGQPQFKAGRHRDSKKGFFLFCFVFVLFCFCLVWFCLLFIFPPFFTLPPFFFFFFFCRKGNNMYSANLCLKTWDEVLFCKLVS